MKDIYVYLTFDAWAVEEPDATVCGQVVDQDDNVLELKDEQGCTHYINLQKVFAVVF